ncbi:hypothetical protein DV738_g506, partial [Chaetothyriales sp. CBS 135597]
MAHAPSSKRAEKRLLVQTTANASNKRRAPYAPRACDACRKRKGRCDGLRPCEYCSSRSAECNYTYTVDDRQNNETTTATATTTVVGTRPPQNHESSSIESLSALVRSMQEHLATLSAQVQASVAANPPQIVKPADIDDGCGINAPEIVVPEPDMLDPLLANTARRAVKRFVGPTSVDYSFNVAELRATHGKHAHQQSSSQRKLPSMEEDQSDEEDHILLEHISTPGSALSTSTQPSPVASLLHFKTLVNHDEAVRLVYVYKDIVDQLHPIYSIDRLLDDIEKVYNWPPQLQTHAISAPPTLPDDLSLLIINVVLCIALCTETLAQSPHCKTILSACENMINAKVVSASLGVKQVTLALLVGLYHFFMGRIPLAWRMCGIAGRQAMELGLHNRDASQQYPDREQSHAEIVALSCSLIVLDRQWSSAAGLPPNFQFTDFELAIKSSVDSPYLKAMMSFVLISHKFNEPISQAARGEKFEDDDAFDVLNFQVEQWIKRSIQDHNFVRPDRWKTMASKRPAAWTILLYLRANAVKAILLRPFFLTQTPSVASKRNIEPALDVVTDTINAITILDETTDIYRKQHSLFQHFLAVSCATLSLLVAYVERHRDSLATELPQDFADTVKDNYRKASRLSAAYSCFFASSRRLWRRLVTMRDTLVTIGILTQDVPSNSGDSSSLARKAQTHAFGTLGGGGRVTEPCSGWGQTNLLAPFSMVDHLSTFDMFCTNTGGGGAGSGGSDFDLDFFGATTGNSEGIGEFH